MFYSKFSFLLLLVQQIYICALLLLQAVDLNGLLVGGMLAACGAVLKFWSQSYDNGDSQYFPIGPYAWVRQPNSLGDLLIILGLLLTSQVAWPALIFLILMTLILRAKIQDIEAFRVKQLGSAYERYQHEIPLLFPSRLRTAWSPKQQVKPLKSVLFEKNQRGVLQVVTLAGFVLIVILKKYIFTTSVMSSYILIGLFALLLLGWYLRLYKLGQLVKH